MEVPDEYPLLLPPRVDFACPTNIKTTAAITIKRDRHDYKNSCPTTLRKNVHAWGEREGI